MRSADVAIVLGAAVYGARPSPVFEERLRHAVQLYRTKVVRRLLFTGGIGKDDIYAESLVARRYAIARGVPAGAILTEAVSHTTLQNLEQARHIMEEHGLGSALLVSDPLHMKRALGMAADLSIAARGSPTPTSRYRSWQARLTFLVREIYFYTVYLVTGQ